MKLLRLKRIKLFEFFIGIYLIWYYLPIARAYFRSGTFNLIFFCFFIIGVALCLFDILIHTKKLTLRFTPLIPILIYMAVFTVLVLFNISTAGRHIRVSFTFWGIMILYYLTKNYPDSQKRLGILLLIMFGITSLTSISGVIVNPRAARILTFASNDIEEDLVIRMLNIGDLSFFQGLVICVPLIYSSIFKVKHKIIPIILICVILFSLLSASFTISLIVFAVAILMCCFVNSSFTSKTIAFMIVPIIVIIVPWSDILSFFSNLINNDNISERLNNLSVALSQNTLTGDLKNRMKLYSASINTFFKHPLGIGPEYTFVDYQNGIGYHSQFFDDLARYGIFAAMFYLTFIWSYFKLLYIQWDIKGFKNVALPTTIVYFLLLILNPGFSSAYESVLILFLLPYASTLLLKFVKK